MACTKFITVSFLALTFGLAACAPSPLYVRSNRIGTLSDIPRDGRGEPRLPTIRSAPAVMPPAPLAPATGTGTPIVPPNN